MKTSDYKMDNSITYEQYKKRLFKLPFNKESG